MKGVDSQRFVFIAEEKRIACRDTHAQIQTEHIPGSAQRILYLLIMLLSIVSLALPIIYQVRAQSFDDQITTNSSKLLKDGKQIFRFDTFGDEAFWGGALKLHQAIEGSKFGGVGPGVSPRTALSLGLKVDADAIKGLNINLDDPASSR